jgi:predicted MFS family arabinose efflux permease
MATATENIDKAPTITVVRALLTVCLPFALGYFLSYLYRTVNAVISERLSQDVGLDAHDLGLLTSAYFLAFAAAQIPLGMFLDRYGPRRVQTILMSVAGIGALIFSVSGEQAGLIVGRGLIGLGVAGGLMASLKAITLWFPKRRWPLFNAIILTTGGVGAMAATTPIQWALGFTDWRGIFMGLAGVSATVAAIIFLSVPERRTTAATPSLGQQLSTLGGIYRDRLFWRVAPITVLIAAAGMAIQTLWSGPWLRDVAGLNQADTASYLLMIAAWMTVGFALGGVITDILTRYGFTLMAIMGTGMLIFILSQVYLVFPFDPLARWPWAIFALSANMMVLAFPILCGHFPLELAGRVNTALNVFVFGGAFAVQYGIGAIIDLFPAGAGNHYPLEAYQAAIGTFLVLQGLTFLWFVLFRKKGI